MIDLINPLLLTIIFAMIVLSAWLIKLWNDPLMKEFHNVYNAVQKIHDGFTPRLGGAIFFISFTIIIFIFDLEGFSFLRLSVFALLPTVLITLIEDVFNNIKPRVRLASIIISSILLLALIEVPLPVINIPYIREFFLSNPVVLGMILIISLSALANGFNLIDGANGILYFSFMSILSSMLILAHGLNSVPFINIYTLLLILTIISIIFNYPVGKIFAGDLGAYCLGLLVGFVTILFFSEHASLITWYVLLILFYPLFELIFTMIRRFKNNKPLMQADSYHMHQLIFSLLKKNYSNYMSNNLVVLILSPIWLFPLIWIFLFGPFMNFLMTWLGIILECLIYIAMYRYVRKLLHD